ncbi:MAG: hypothetical protein KJ607_07580 [Bacteroidetes bacterium]|nr:hypothetical protein [Bacteroidota bacterium]
MNIQAVKIELMRMIISTENPSVLDKIMRIVQNEKQDFWNELSKEEQDDILAGIEELDNGEKFGYEETVSKYRK